MRAHILRKIATAGALAAATLVGSVVVAAPASASTPVSAPSCHGQQLKGTLRLLGAAAGTRYTIVELRNTSTKTCTLRGTPSIRFLANKRATGATSEYGSWVATDGKVHRSAVKLTARGGKAYLRVGIADAADYTSSCHAVQADALRITLPHVSSTHALVPVPLGTTALKVCTNSHDRQLSVSHFAATAHGK